jgi:hypothetical protein
MKTLFILFVILAGFSAAYSQDFNAAATDHNVTFNSIVIAPFSVWNATQEQGQGMVGTLPPVIQGQTRTFTTPLTVKLFGITKEANYNVYLFLDCPQSVGGLSFIGHWYFYDTPDPEFTDFPQNQVNQQFAWTGTQNTGWIALHINSVTATPTCTLGQTTFEASVTGYYYGL